MIRFSPISYNGYIEFPSILHDEVMAVLISSHYDDCLESSSRCQMEICGGTNKSCGAILIKQAYIDRFDRYNNSIS